MHWSQPCDLEKEAKLLPFADHWRTGGCVQKEAASFCLLGWHQQRLSSREVQSQYAKCILSISVGNSYCCVQQSSRTELSLKDSSIIIWALVCNSTMDKRNTSLLWAFHGGGAVLEEEGEVGSFISEWAEILVWTSTWNSYRGCHYFTLFYSIMIHYGTDVLEMCYEEEVGHHVLSWHREEVARRRDDIVTKAVLQKPNTMENLLWKSDIISFQNRGSLHALFFFFWPQESHKALLCLQRVFSWGCLWWNQQIVSFAVSSTLPGTGANYSLSWPASLELSASWGPVMSYTIYNGLWIQLNIFPRN